jgi:nitroimidazol reductase NimA-like FMN-containing flavoprotein (pyridoxamine 5'-phosphate oxidase superfamily)
MSDDPRWLRELPTGEAMRLLSSVPIGRIAFTSRALPAVRVVNHLVADGQVIIRSHDGSAIVSAANAARGTVVAFEADQIDPVSRTGWSVVVTGIAWLVADAERIARYEQVLRPWVTGDMNQMISIDPQLVTGLELVAGRPPGAA